MITLDVRNKLVEIHLVSASGRHEGGSARNLAVFMICTCSLGFKGDGRKIALSSFSGWTPLAVVSY